MDARTDGQRENSIPPTNKVCGGYNNHRAHPLGVIQVKKDSSNKKMLRSEGETSDGVGMCLEIGRTIY